MKTLSALSFVAASFLTAVHGACDRHESLSASTESHAHAVVAAQTKPVKSAPSAGKPAAPQPKPAKETPDNARPALPAHLFM